MIHFEQDNIGQSRYHNQGVWDMGSPNDARAVYVSGIGRIRYCRRCGQPEENCQCSRQASHAAQPGFPKDGYVRVARESKGRRGKVVTLVAGLPDEQQALLDLAQTLRRLCGAGGTVREGVVELQGDHRDRVVGKLTELGYKVKRVGA